MQKRLIVLAVLFVLGLALGAAAKRTSGNTGAKPETPATQKTAGNPAEAKSAVIAKPAEPVKPAKAVDRRELERLWMNGRPVKPPLALYLFTGGPDDLEPLGGTLAPPGLLQPWKLTAEGPITPSPKGMVFQDGGRLSSRHAGGALAHAIKLKGLFTLEAGLTPADQQHGGPARIVSLSGSTQKRNLTLGQEKSDWVVRVRTTASGENGMQPELRLPGLAAERKHVLFTYDGKVARLYVNGQETKLAQTLTGGLENWDIGFPLLLGNELGEARPWAGTLRFFAFYDYVLSPAEARQAFESLYPEGAALGVIAPEAPAKSGLDAKTQPR